MSWDGVDNLLDQLEEEVEKERRLKQKEQATESDKGSVDANLNKEVYRPLDGLIIPSTVDPTTYSASVPEKSPNIEEVTDQHSSESSPNSSENLNGRQTESDDKKDLQITSTLNKPEQIIQEVSVDVSLSFERQESASSPAHKTLNDERRLIDEATILESDVDSQQNGHIDQLNTTTQIDDKPLKEDTQSDTNEGYRPKSKLKTELIDPNADLQEAIKAMPKEDGLDFETIANQQQELDNEVPSDNEEIDTEETNGIATTLPVESVEVEKVIELEKSTNSTSEVDFTTTCEQTETVDLNISITKEESPKGEDLSNEQVVQIVADSATETEVQKIEDAFELAKNLLEEIGDVNEILALAKERNAAKAKADESPKIEESVKAEETPKEDEQIEEDQPGTSQRDSIDKSPETEEQKVEELPESPIKEQKKSVILSTHAVGNNVGNDLRLTESELQLGKAKPIWIRDEECKKCMLCSVKFTLVNRRHHCRCCGRVLCSECCSVRRSLPYMQQDEKKQRVCSPCNSTLDRIELYEKAVESSVVDQPSSSSTTEPQTSSFFVRKKSVLKKTRTKSENEATQTEQPSTQTEQLPTQPSESTSLETRRSVKFLDGVSPGDELSPASQQAEQEKRQSGMFSSRSNRSSRSSSRRTREVIAKEENLRLNAQYFYYCNEYNSTGPLKPWREADLFKRLEENLPVRLILKRNIHVILQFIEYQGKPVYSLYTAGFNTLGVDELFIVFEKKQEIQFPVNLIRSLARYSEMCLDPTTNLLDDKNGIRQCANRMDPLFEIEPHEAEGHNAVAIYFHPYQSQDLTSIGHPSNGAFRIGLFVQEPELPLLRAMPSRFLHRLGMVTSVYPTPILNELDRQSVFEPFKTTNELASSTILTMFHDFRNNTYQLPKIAGSYSLIRETGTTICLPVWAQDQMKRMAESNSNLLAWALELSYQADSLFSCERLGNTFSTRIFMRSNTRETISASFIAFSTGHKGAENGYTQTVVEDGLVIRLSSDGLENLLKKLANGDDFKLETEAGMLEIKWLENEELTAYGSITSPIDGTDLRGFYQYGLLLNRALHANQIFYSDKSKALRLGSVISLTQNKIAPQIQSHFFDACEQLTLWLKISLENYVQMLLSLDITQISIRIYASAERVGYEVGSWLGLEEAYDEFLKLLAEKIIPFLYHLLESTQIDFRVELHLPLISIYPLFTLDSEIPIRSVPYSSVTSNDGTSEEPQTSSS